MMRRLMRSRAVVCAMSGLPLVAGATTPAARCATNHMMVVTSSRSFATVSSRTLAPQASSSTAKNNTNTISSRRTVGSSSQALPTAPSDESGVTDNNTTSDVDVGELEAAPASNLTLKDVAGPWLVMSKALEGELMIYEDGMVSFKCSGGAVVEEMQVGVENEEATGAGGGAQPSPSPAYLTNSIGKIRLHEESTGAPSDSNDPSTPPTITLLSITLEVYAYDKKSPHTPPFRPTTVTINGMVNNTFSAKASYTTMTLVGHVDVLKDIAGNDEGTMSAEDLGKEGATNTTPANHNNAEAEEEEQASLFYAAKLVPWDASTDGKSLKWRPKKDVHDSFEALFGHLPLAVDSHVVRAKTAAEAMMKKAKAAMGLAGGGGDKNTHLDSSSALTLPTLLPPYHMDLSPYKVGGDTIRSIYYIPNYISESEELQFMAHLKATPDALKSKLHKRTCQEWGGSMCGECQQSFLADASIPQWSQKINDMLLHDGIFTPTTFPNSVRIHEYDQYEGIGPHCDGPIYVPRVAVLSLASTSVMHFYPRHDPYTTDITKHYNDTFAFEEGAIGRSGKPIVSVVVEPRSLLLFTDEAFTHYPHGVSDKPIDDLKGLNVVNRHLLSAQHKNIESIIRQYRASCTIRNLLPRCDHEPGRNIALMKRAWYVYHQEKPPATEWDMTSSIPNNDTAVERANSQPTTTTTTTSGSSATATGSTSKKEQPLFDLTAAEANAMKPPSIPATTDYPLITNLQHTLGKLSAQQDQLAKDVADMKHSIEELKAIVGYAFTSTQTFQKETSSILNNLSMAVMDLSSKQEELSDEVMSVKEKVGGNKQ